MQACEADDPNRLRTIDDLYNLVLTIGFLPLFACSNSPAGSKGSSSSSSSNGSNGLSGFSVEERVTAEQWWTGDSSSDPWEWRIMASRHPDIAYGKFFDRKAGFISKEWFPVFANYRREGYDFEALFEDELASYRSKKIMDALGVDDEGQSSEIMSNELKTLAGFGKRADGSAGEKNYEGILTELQMQSYVIMSDFQRRKNKKGQDYGWHIAMISTPETKWGYEAIASGYKESPQASWERIKGQIKRFFPEADDESIYKLLGIRWASVTGTAASVDNKSGRGKKSAAPRERKTFRPQELPWPENIITEMHVSDVLGKDEYEPLNDDQMEGLSFAISTLKDSEQKVIKLRYEEHRTLKYCGKEMGLSDSRIQQIAKKAIRKLHHPSRTVYIREGYQSHLERKQAEKLKVQSGVKNMTDDERIEFLEGIKVSDVGLSARSYNCLRRAGIDTMADVLRKAEEGNVKVNLTAWTVDVKGLLGIRNLGKKSTLEVLEKLEEYGVDISNYVTEYGLEGM